LDHEDREVTPDIAIVDLGVAKIGTLAQRCRGEEAPAVALILPHKSTKTED
jgi:hypothetical protein